jgi:hypothetical protein
MQKGRLDSPNLDASLCEPLDTLVKERTGQRARTIRDRDDHTIEMGGPRLANRADGVHGVGAILPNSEDVHLWSLEHLRASRSPQMLPTGGSLRVPGAQSRHGEAGPDPPGHPSRERAFVVDEYSYRRSQHRGR